MYQNEFRAIGIDAPNRSKGTIKVKCPKCIENKGANRVRNKNLSLNYTEGFYKCHAGSCGFQGRVTKKEWSRPEWKNRTDLPARVVKYFESRGISQKTLNKFRITTDEKGNIQFNYFRHDALINIKTRYELKDGKKSFSQHAGAEKILYNIDSIEGKEKVVIVEGEMDVLSWAESEISKEYGIISVDQGAPNPGDRTDLKLECFKNCALELDGVKQFFICTDKDAPGEYLQKEIIRRFGAYRCNIIDLPAGYKDSNAVLDRRGGNDYPHDTNKQTLREALKNALPVPLDGVITLSGEISDLMDRYFEEGRPKGQTTHFPQLDEYYKFLAGDTTLVTGIPGHGKGQFVRQLAVVKSHFDGWRWACYVPEDFPADVFFDEIIHTYIGMSPYKGHSNQMTKEDYHRAKEWVKDHFFCIYPEPDDEGNLALPSNEWINKRINFLKLKHGVNAYIKDPWNKIYHNFGKFGGREDQYLAAELSKEKFFAAGFDAAIYIAHPKQMYKNKDGSIPCPGPYDISGGSMWFNQIDNIITVHRPLVHENPNDNRVEWHSKKIKKQKLVGVKGVADLWFDLYKNRYYEVGPDFNPMEGEKSAVEVEDEWFDETAPF
jgi:twinkle protein